MLPCALGQSQPEMQSSQSKSTLMCPPPFTNNYIHNNTIGSTWEHIIMWVLFVLWYNTLFSTNQAREMVLPCIKYAVKTSENRPNRNLQICLCMKHNIQTYPSDCLVVPLVGQLLELVHFEASVTAWHDDTHRAVAYRHNHHFAGVYLSDVIDEFRCKYSTRTHKQIMYL